jgi:hypothetical protein
MRSRRTCAEARRTDRDSVLSIDAIAIAPIIFRRPSYGYRRFYTQLFPRDLIDDGDGLHGQPEIAREPTHRAGASIRPCASMSFSFDIKYDAIFDDKRDIACKMAILENV